jgi:hypothetical protein
VPRQGSTLLLPRKFHPAVKGRCRGPCQPEPGRRINDLIALSRDVMTHGGKRFVSIFFWSSTIPGLLHAAERWFKVEEQGPLNQLWENAAPAEALIVTVAINKDGKEVADFVFNAQNRADDIALVRDMSFMFDDDNKPAPENVPADGTPPVNGEALLEGQKWGWDGIDRQAMLQGLMYNGPTFANEWSPNGKPFIDISLHFLPWYFLEVTIVKATSNALLMANAVCVLTCPPGW